MRVLYLDLDTLRPDHLGCYGYHRDTSPNIDRIAEEGVRFTNCFCSDSPCCPSRAALMTGRFGYHTGLVGHGGTAGDMRLEGSGRGFRDRMGSQNVPAIFRKAGFRTACFSPFAERHGAWWFHAGFNETYNTGKAGMESAEEVTPDVLDWLNRNGRDDNWFLHVNYWDPHVPFRAPDDFGNPFENDPLPSWLTAEEVQRQQQQAGVQMPLFKQDVFKKYRGGTWHGVAQCEFPPLPRNPDGIRSLDDVRMIIDGYDCGVRYMDSHLGMLFSKLEELGVMDDTAVVISSDHGENLGELGIYGDHITADYITHHIPLIVKWPGGLKGRVDNNLHYNLDLAPTYADLLGVEHAANWDGQSFAETVKSGDACGHDALILSHGAGTCQRSVRFGDWYYIQVIHDGYNLFPAEMLFNITEDPHETCNLIESRPEIAEQARKHLRTWTDEMQATMPEGYSEDPFTTVIREGGPSHVRNRELDQIVQRLKDAGLDEKADELAQRHTNSKASE